MSLFSRIGGHYQSYWAARQATVARGYFYEYRQGNGGRGVIGYDLDAGRAYYQSSPR